MYYPIDENMARLSHEMMSLSGYETGSATAGYRAAVDEATALVEQQKQKISPFYHEKLDGLLDRYARRLAEWTNDHNRNGASCPSVLVCGSANFPTRKKAKQNAREDSLWKEYDEIKGILSKIKSVGTGPIDPTDPHAREMLEDQLQSLQNKLETGKAMNAHYRKHKTMKGFRDFSDETAAKMDDAIKSAPPFAQTPFPDFELTSIRGKIKRTQENLAKLDGLEQHKDDAANTLEFDGGKIFLNMEANRLQIFFDEIPAEEIRSSLKSHGFKWSRKNEAWQRQLTRNAIYDAKRILGITNTKPATTTAQEAAPRQSPAPRTAKPKSKPPPRGSCRRGPPRLTSSPSIPFPAHNKPARPGGHEGTTKQTEVYIMNARLLKPCPFCGYEFPLIRYSNSGGCFYISCEHCDIHLRLGAGEKERIKSRIVDAWNKRVSTS